jgi:hypothetical protein
VTGGVVVVLGALAPALVSALRAGASLFMLACLLAIGWAGAQALPYFGQWIEKRCLRARVLDARANPVEELLRELLLRSEQLVRYRSALTSIAAQIESMRDMLTERRASAPQHDTTKQATALQKMIKFHAHHVDKLAAAELALADYKQHLSAKRFEWDFAQSGQQVLDSLKSEDREGILRELLSDEATRSVQSSFNRVFASLDLELRVLERPALARELS